MTFRTLAAAESTRLSSLPLAAPGLTSYRARGIYGFVMIGARNHAEALREAHRSTPTPSDLEVWDGTRYVPATPENEP